MKLKIGLLALVLAMSASGAMPAFAQMQGIINSGHVLGNGTSNPRTPTDTPLLNVLEQGILGTSVNTPGTGTLESLLPVQTVTGASKTYATADLFQKTRRSNSGSAMTDTLPASTVTGLANGTRINIVNVDASATDTLTAGAGTSIASGCTAIGPGRDEALVYDLANTTWRGDYNSCGVLLGANNLSDVASVSTARANLDLTPGTGLAISGSNLNLQPPTLSVIGGVEAINQVSHEWIYGITTGGVPELSQPAIGDISGFGSNVATALGNAFNGSGGVLGASLASADLFIGSSGGVATAQPLSGDCSLTNTGAITCLKVNGVAFGALATVTPGTGVATALADNTNATGGISTYPVAQSTLSGLGTGVSTALGDNVGSAGAFVVNGGALGTPSSGTATNLTGLPLSTGITGFGTNVATTLGNAINAASGLPNIDGSITTGDCLKWGPGIEDAGATCGSGGGGSPGGSTGALQYNDSGSFGGVTIASGDIPLGGGSGAPTDSGLTPTGTGWTTQSAGTDNTSLATTAFVATCGNAPGERCLLTTLTASNSADLQDTTHLTSAYIHYALVFNNIVPATAEKVCEILVYYDGSFQTSGYLALGTAAPSNAASPAITATTTYIPCALGNAAGNDVGNTSTGISGEIDINNPSSTSNSAQFSGTTTAVNGSGNFSAYNDFGMLDASGYAVTGIEILMSSGNITSGTVQIYGWN